jgi:hypothetical protein
MQLPATITNAYVSVPTPAHGLPNTSPNGTLSNTKPVSKSKLSNSATELPRLRRQRQPLLAMRKHSLCFRHGTPAKTPLIRIAAI